MEFKLTLFDDAIFQRTAEVIQFQLKAIGIKANIDVQDASAAISMIKAGNHELFVWTYFYADASILSYQFQTGSGGNRTFFSNTDLGPLLTAADAEMDPAARNEKVGEILIKLNDLRPNIPLLSPYNYIAYRNDRLDGIFFSLDSSPLAP